MWGAPPRSVALSFHELAASVSELGSPFVSGRRNLQGRGQDSPVDMQSWRGVASLSAPCGLRFRGNPVAGA